MNMSQRIYLLGFPCIEAPILRSAAFVQRRPPAVSDSGIYIYEHLPF
jgi:hypothetical protein